MTNTTFILSLKNEKLSHKINAMFIYEGEENWLPMCILKHINVL